MSLWEQKVHHRINHMRLSIQQKSCYLTFKINLSHNRWLYLIKLKIILYIQQLPQVHLDSLHMYLLAAFMGNFDSKELQNLRYEYDIRWNQLYNIRISNGCGQLLIFQSTIQSSMADVMNDISDKGNTRTRTRTRTCTHTHTVIF